MTLKMCRWGTGDRNGLALARGVFHGAEGPRVLELVVK